MHKEVILQRKIDKFKESLKSTLDAKSRFVFLLPGVDNIDEYIRQKIKDREKQKRLEKAKSILKMITALVMSTSFALIIKTMMKMLDTISGSYELAKAAQEKRKKKKKNNRENRKRRKKNEVQEVETTFRDL